MPLSQVYHYESFVELLSYAESLGFVEPDEFDVDEWSPELADGLQEEVIEYLATIGIRVEFETH